MCRIIFFLHHNKTTRDLQPYIGPKVIAVSIIWKQKHRSDSYGFIQVESTHQYSDGTSTRPFFRINDLYLHNISVDQTICDIIKCNCSSIHFAI